jgi:AcrR family transcriptional regulator
MTHKTPKKQYHHGNLRQQLLDTAAVLIREDGEPALSMRKLAEKLGVSRMAPYHHFEDKEALLCGVAEAGFERFMHSVMAVATDLNALEVTPYSKDHLGLFVTTYLNFATQHPEYYNLMFGGHLWQSTTITDSLRDAGHAAFRSYVDMIRAWKNADAINPAVDPLRFAQLSWSTLHGMSRLFIDGIYVDEGVLTHLCHTATDSFWAQLHG